MKKVVDLLVSWMYNTNINNTKEHIMIKEINDQITKQAESKDDAQIMTLRDQFAIAALNAVLSTYNWSIGEQANHAYEIADAMMKARKNN
jgi:hypothetical protein